MVPAGQIWRLSREAELNPACTYVVTLQRLRTRYITGTTFTTILQGRKRKTFPSATISFEGASHMIYLFLAYQNRETYENDLPCLIVNFV